MFWSFDEDLYQKTQILDLKHLGITQILIDGALKENHEVIGALRTPKWWDEFQAGGSVDTQALTVIVPNYKVFQVVGTEVKPSVQLPADAYAAILKIETEAALDLAKVIREQILSTLKEL